MAKAVQNIRHSAGTVRIASAAGKSYLLGSLGIFWLGLLVVGGIFTASPAMATPAFIELPLQNFTKAQVDQLEADVWLESPEALPHLENTVSRLIQIDAYNARYHYLLAKVLIRRHLAEPQNLLRLKKASELGQQAYDLQPSEEYGRVVTAEILQLLGQSKEAESILRLDDKVSRKSWRSELLYVQNFVARKNPDEALKRIDALMARKHVVKEIPVPIVIKITKSRYDPAQQAKVFKRWYDRHKQDSFLYSLAAVYSQLRQYRKASDIFRTMYDSHAAGIEAQINDGIINYRFLKSPAKATQLLERVHKRHYDQLMTSNKVVVNTHLGILATKADKPKKAQEYFLAAIHLDRSPPDYLRYLKSVHNRQKKIGQFKEILEFFTDEVPGEAAVHGMLGRLYADDLKDHKKAVRYFANAIVLDPEDSALYADMGMSYYRLKRFNDAMGLFTLATQKDPSDATAFYNLACVQAVLKLESAAIKSLKQAVSLDPGLRHAAQKDRDFTNIRHHAFFKRR